MAWTLSNLCLLRRAGEIDEIGPQKPCMILSLEISFKIRYR